MATLISIGKRKPLTTTGRIRVMGTSDEPNITVVYNETYSTADNMILKLTRVEAEALLVTLSDKLNEGLG